MTFSEQALQNNQQMWQESIHHPFIKQLSDGSMPEDVFRYYLIQDHHYLHDFAKIHELTAATSNDGHVKRMLAELAAGLRAGEISTRETFFKDLGISDDDVRQTPLAPTTYAYTSHMYRTLTDQGVAAAVAGLLPCAWLYADIGKHLIGLHSPVPVYQAWIDSYQADDYVDSVADQLALTNAIAQQADEATQAKMQTAFARSTHYERDFWQMALDKQQWK